MNEGLNVLASIDIAAQEDLYVLVDFLNRNLKDKEIIFGLSKSHEEGRYKITLYRTTE